MNENKENSKYLCEKAIDGYIHITERYKDWMNLYAIFTGAFFIAYYTLCKSKTELSVLIIILGLITSFCWLFSFYGYYHWLISWNKILHYHENLFLKDSNLSGKYRIYSFYFQPKGKPLYSTQKITEKFLFCVIGGWFVLLFNPAKELILQYFGISFCCCDCCCFILYVFFVAISCFLIRCFFKEYCMSDISKMKELTEEQISNEEKETENNISKSQ